MHAALAGQTVPAGRCADAPHRSRQRICAFAGALGAAKVVALIGLAIEVVDEAVAGPRFRSSADRVECGERRVGL
jgi:hypothetical protein